MEHEIHRINVIRLVDVMLVLLVIVANQGELHKEHDPPIQSKVRM